MKNLVSLFGLIFLITLIATSTSLAQCPVDDPDSDGDGLCNSVDPCPTIFNPNPVDTDGDGVYDACDNCVDTPNALQTDIDNDAIGDLCDSCIDPDNDSVCGAEDLCPGADDKIDVDGDNIPDACDDCIDVDRDEICDEDDDCIGTEEQGKACNDLNPCTINDMFDFDCKCKGTYSDTDGDGICDGEDICPGSDDNLDFDGDGIPDGCDPDPACSECGADAQGKITICLLPLNPDNMRSIRGTCDELGSYFDSEGSLSGDNTFCGPCQCSYVGDVDTDGDGVCDRMDECPNNPSKSDPGSCGCEDQDSDDDGVCDSSDVCPGHDDSEDEDGDGIPDACDEVNYCVPTADHTMEWIESIVLGGITLNNDQSNAVYFHSQPITLYQRDIHTLTVSTEHIDELCELSVMAWIDSNNDGDFEDPGEELFALRSLEDVSADVNFDDLSVGQYRMRVIVHYGRILSPCMPGIQGEVEDFLVDLQEPESCRAIYEGFDYSTDPIMGPLNGGDGWSDAWSTSLNGAAQIAIMSGSLASQNNAGQFNRMGLLCFQGASISMNRNVDISLKGSEVLTLSMLVEPISGSGQLTIGLNDIIMGFNSQNQLYLGNQTGPVLNVNQTYHLLLKANIDQNGDDDIFLWLDPVSTSPDEADALQDALELGDDITSLNMDISGESDFVPLVVILDEINLGCDQNFSVQSGFTPEFSENAALPGTNPDGTEVTVNVFPNPVHNSIPSIILRGAKDAQYASWLYNINGTLIWRGNLVVGFNSLSTIPLTGGLYYLITETKKGSLTNKIIVN